MIITVSEFLKRAKARIEDPSHFCQGALCRTESGDIVYGGTRGPDAYSFCSIGSLIREQYEVLRNDPLRDTEAYKLYSLASNYLGDVFGENGITSQDSMSHEEVMKRWDLAIQMAIAEEGVNP